MKETMAHRNSALGDKIRLLRTFKGWTQAQLAERVTPPVSRSAITHLEAGRRIPESETLQNIFEILDLPSDQWEPFLDENWRRVVEFEDILSELAGTHLTLDGLDEPSITTAQAKIGELFTNDLTKEQAFDAFRSLLVYYSIKPISRAMFERYFHADSFKSNRSFREAASRYQLDAIRLFSTFGEAYEALASASNLEQPLQALAKRPDDHYRERTEWKEIQLISEDRLPDLGYIAAARVRQENAERTTISKFLRDLAGSIRNSGAAALDNIAERKRRKMDSLLRKFDPGSRHSLFSPLFLPDPDQLERKAEQLGPKEEIDLSRMAETQQIAQQNLANYLSADYLDVYVATSMRSDADFVSVNRFVQQLFSHVSIRPLRLRYFNPTQSWIDDRVAKGLVEALMLRRASLTIYMAQKEDTFGKDSEASVALGQGKPVIVYVPKLSVPTIELDTEKLGLLDRNQLEELVNKEGFTEDRDFDETVDHEALLGRLLTIRLGKADEATLISAVRDHWADFDLYGEDERIEKGPDRSEYRAWLDKITKHGDSVPPPDSIKDRLISILVATALRFERRARIFREVHPLALQVILSTGVLNGILVSRSVSSCGELIKALIRNDLDLKLQVDDDNYRLVEQSTGSTIRVISKNKLLKNAFSVFYSIDPKP